MVFTPLSAVIHSSPQSFPATSCSRAQARPVQYRMSMPSELPSCQTSGAMPTETQATGNPCFPDALILNPQPLARNSVSLTALKVLSEPLQWRKDGEFASATMDASGTMEDNFCNLVWRPLHTAFAMKDSRIRSLSTLSGQHHAASAL